MGVGKVPNVYGAFEKIDQAPDLLSPRLGLWFIACLLPRPRPPARRDGAQTGLKLCLRAPG
jgi:hypothetical protein